MLNPRHVFQTTTNGVAVEMTGDEAARIAALPGVTTVRRERILHTLTDAGPQWIGASQVWTGQVAGIAATKGAGVVIGIIDTGINATHPSFATLGGDGYSNVNSRGQTYGLCATGAATCTQKLIGIYDMTNEGSNGADTVGHGSHVSGIAAGNAIVDALNGMTTSLSRNVSGVAPHANIIMYKACVSKSGTGTCDESDLVAAIDQATADGVDVINYSIGGDGVDAYTLLNDTTTDGYAFFQARAAGVVIAAAAGNDGPGAHSLGEPGNVPWVIGVANASHNRTFANTIGNFSGAANAPPSLSGQGFTAGYGPANIVYAGNFGSALCGTGATQGTSPTGASNPFPAGTFHGEIVICDRGTYARVEKGYNVKAAGAGGYILANAQADGESVISDDHYLPAVHLGYTEGDQLKSWVASSGIHDGTISGVAAILDAANGDILEADSSRGPYGFGGGILKPDITAPGSNILSSSGSSPGLALLSGTSMATPHIAGSAALLIAAHPAWNPSQVESALLTSAVQSIREPDKVTPATPRDQGNGRVQPAVAEKAGLYLPLSATDIRAQDPSRGGDPSKLNRAGIESEACAGHCTFQRTVTDMSGGGTWTISTTASAHAAAAVSPSQFTLAAGASQVLTISVDVSNPSLPGTWSSGRILLHKSTGGQSASDTALTFDVFASTGAAPAFQDISTIGPGGSRLISLSGLVALPEATFTPTYLVPATVTGMSLGVDPQPNDIYTTFPGTGKAFVLYPIVEQTGTDSGNHSTLLIAEITATDAPLTRLYAGIDSNADGTPEFAEQACASEGAPGQAIRCVVDLRGTTASNAWALVEVPQGNSANYSIELSGGVTGLRYVLGEDPQQTENLFAVGPGHVDASETFPLRIFWQDAAYGSPIVPNTTYYGSVLIDATPGGNGDVGVVPLRLTRTPGNDDVIDALQPGDARSGVLEAGESLQHRFVDVNGTGTLTVMTSYSGATGAMSFYVARADFPSSSSAPTVTAAPANNGAVTWTLDATTTNKTVNVPVTSGRWYIVATNTGAQEAQWFMSTALSATPAFAPTPPGGYYNPDRSGHGIFTSQTSGTQVAYWYTFLEDGTPAWYQAQQLAPAADSTAWTSPIYRIVWDGSKVNATPQVGDITLTPIGATDAIFSWHLFGQRGSERFAQLSGTDCVSLGSSSVGLSGQWFPPAQPGYGVDVVAQPDLQFDAFYLYDALGQPRWLVGSSGPFAPSMTIAMNQVSGFCPLCAFVQTVLNPVGNLNIAFNDASSGTFSTNITLAPPLAGTWNVNQPIARLTGTASCSP